MKTSFNVQNCSTWNNHFVLKNFVETYIIKFIEKEILVYLPKSSTLGLRSLNVVNTVSTSRLVISPCRYCK